MSYENTQKAFATSISGAGGSGKLNQLQQLRNLKPRPGSYSTGPIARYFSLKDTEKPFARLNIGLKVGVSGGLLVAACYCPFNHFVAPSPMSNIISGIKIVGFGAAAGMTHSACVSIISDLRHGSDDYLNHFMAGLVSGSVLACTSRTAGPVFFSAMGVALVTSLIKQAYVKNWAFNARSKMPTLTGIRNNQVYLSLNQKYMNPEWKAQEEHLEKHI